MSPPAWSSSIKAAHADERRMWPTWVGFAIGCRYAAAAASPHACAARRPVSLVTSFAARCAATAVVRCELVRGAPSAKASAASRAARGRGSPDETTVKSVSTSWALCAAKRATARSSSNVRSKSPFVWLTIQLSQCCACRNDRLGFRTSRPFDCRKVPLGGDVSGLTFLAGRHGAGKFLGVLPQGPLVAVEGRNQREERGAECVPYRPSSNRAMARKACRADSSSPADRASRGRGISSVNAASKTRDPFGRQSTAPYAPNVSGGR
ncbi:hypothetical protein RCH07_003838 [Arthrobacter sp. CG_A4]|nr:hypothetical protein [Arthrobacter sp. CG_A4]